MNSRQDLTIGERVAWYRRRRGMSQEVLAGLVDRTTDWLSKVENNRIDVDRLSVIRTLAAVLHVTMADLSGDPSLLARRAASGREAMPALRDALLDYRQLSPLMSSTDDDEPVTLEDLSRRVHDVWNAYQSSRYGYVVNRLPELVRDAQRATCSYTGGPGASANAHLALTYQAAAVLLTKLGEADLAWIAAERGFIAAQASDNVVVIVSLFRSITHALLSIGRYREAKSLPADAAEFLEPEMSAASPELLSVRGALFLTGAVAAARDGDRQVSRAFLAEADASAQRLKHDANYLWTAFGPCNVAVHRVATAMDLGDVQVAVDLVPRIDTCGLPVERRVRHTMETARALSARGRDDEALGLVLDAEQIAPEQIRHHTLSRQLVLTWVRRSRGKPSHQLTALARRVRVVQ